MHRSLKLFCLLLVILFSVNSVSAQGKRGIGLFPFENLGNQKKYNWISFGFHYLLSNKLSNIAAYYVPDKKIINKALSESGHGNRKIDGEMVYHVGKKAGINIGITGSYSTNGKTITVNIDFINAFNGANIFTKKYDNKFDEIFFIADDIIQNLIDLSTVPLSDTEQTILNRQLTNSAKAFQNFCLGYIENEKSKREREKVI